ncbi:MAG: PAS domain-containing protein [Oscillospiraceae bacterium]|nr:PAS domain-containing protein [Oscillospiraceae bacterium]
MEIITRQNIELVSICVVSMLLVIFASLYFYGTRKRKTLSAAIKNSNDLYDSHDKELSEFAEKMRIMTAQLELIFELSPAFSVCYDYSQNCFYMSENGQSQLGCGEADQNNFENLIHPDDFSLYEEVTNCGNIRRREIADSPYVIRLKDTNGQYGKYLMRAKPIYDEDGANTALAAAFIKTEYIAEKT